MLEGRRQEKTVLSHRVHGGQLMSTTKQPNQRLNFSPVMTSQVRTSQKCLCTLTIQDVKIWVPGTKGQNKAAAQIKLIQQWVDSTCVHIHLCIVYTCVCTCELSTCANVCQVLLRRVGLRPLGRLTFYGAVCAEGSHHVLPAIHRESSITWHCSQLSQRPLLCRGYTPSTTSGSKPQNITSPSFWEESTYVPCSVSILWGLLCGVMAHPCVEGQFCFGFPSRTTHVFKQD